MKTLSVFMWFHRPERNFHKLSYSLEKLPIKINELNNKREYLQKKISELSSISNLCELCQGKCCRGDYNHYTQVDLLIRMFSDKPIKETGSIWPPKSIPRIITDKFIEIVENKNKNVHFNAITPIETAQCPNLKPDGCAHSAEDRPIRCILWTCQTMRDSLPEDKLKEVGLLTQELGNIPLQVMREYRNCYKYC